MGLADAIRGRVSRTNIVNPITDEVIVREDELITVDKARKIEEMGLERIQVRSPMTCEAPLGMCQLCYGMDLSTGDLVEQGMAVGLLLLRVLVNLVLSLPCVPSTSVEWLRRKLNRASCWQSDLVRFDLPDPQRYQL